jgi:hypothetical protein
MNTEVNYEISKLLKDKGFKGSTHANWWILYKDHHENYKKRLPVDESKVFFAKNSYDLDLKIQIDEEREHNVFHVLSAPTISEVVMWLYEEHGIWTVVNVNIMGSWYFEHFDLKEKRNAEFKPTDTHYDSPTEAYEAAIEYTLKNLL